MTFIQNIFSMVNQESDNNKIYDVITIFGIKLKFLNKHKTILKKLKATDDN